MKKAEKKRLLTLQRIEQEIRLQGYKFVVGLDEAGRGPLAGPVVAAVCHIPEDIYIPGVADSKILLPEKRAAIFQQIQETPEIAYSVGLATVEEIDTINIFQATKLAMRRAIEGLGIQPDFLLIDGFGMPELSFPQKKIIKGDSLSYCIAAASIIAKETRDAMMVAYDKEFPDYGFARHKGYATVAHKEAIRQHGRCLIHRKSFAIND